MSESSPGNSGRKVSCLIVTADRRHLLKRSLHAFRHQTHSPREVVVVDNGTDPVEDLLEELPAGQVQYVRIAPDPNLLLGDLRNISLEHATGDYMICWDDDDWFHPRRIEIQLAALEEGYDACCLEGNLFHIDTEDFVEHPYRGALPEGSPSSIIHRRNGAIRYPSLPREEDTVYLNRWRNLRYRKLPLSYSWLFVRCFHGTNVSGKSHFLRRLRNSPSNWIRYMWHANIRGNLFRHPRFQLSDTERESFHRFLEVSREFELIRS